MKQPGVLQPQRGPVVRAGGWILLILWRKSLVACAAPMSEPKSSMMV